MAQNDTQKSIYEMSDTEYIEFLSYGEYKNSPYYKDYYEAKRTTVAPTANNSNVTGQSVAVCAAGKRYKKRSGALLLVAFLMLLVIAVCVFSYVQLDKVTEYVSPYKTANGDTVSVVDPIFAFLQKFDVMKNADSVYYKDCIINLDTESDTLTLASYYALPIATVLFVVFALAIFIAALVGANKKTDKDGCVLKKTKLITVTVLTFLFAAVMTVCAAIWAGGIAEFVPFITGKTTHITIGYGLYGLLGLSFLAFIINLFSYKKVK